jgi:hypothetical protein
LNNELSGLSISVDNGYVYATDPSGTSTGIDPTSGSRAQGIANSAAFIESLNNDTSGEFATNMGTFVEIGQPATGFYRLVVKSQTTAIHTLRLTGFSHDGSTQPQLVVPNIPGGGVSTGFSVQYDPAPGSVPSVIRLRFSDVFPNDYFYGPVSYLADHGILSGYADGTFRPFNDTTRGQLTKIVVLAQGWPIDTSSGPHFSDVPTANPFYNFIETAYQHGIISWYADGTFRWGSNVTRGQLSKIITLAEGWSIDTSGGPHFNDVSVANPFYSFIETAYHHSIVSGYADGTFRPGNNATRGQIAKMVYIAITAQGTPPSPVPTTNTPIPANSPTRTPVRATVTRVPANTATPTSSRPPTNTVTWTPTPRRTATTTPTWTPVAGQSPGPPTNLTATALDPNDIELTWTAPGGIVDGYNIYDGDIFVTTVPASTTSYTVSGLAPNSYHCYMVFSYNAYGTSPGTPWACATTPPGPPPAPPSDVVATSLDSTHIRLDWINNAPDAIGFDIYDGDIWVTTVLAPTVSYTVSGLAPNSYHCYTIFAYNDYGTSSGTPWACATTPP